MDLALRKRVVPLSVAPVPSELHLWRSGGLGDFVFMEPALRKLKAQHPSRKLILHAPEKYRYIHNLIGFDEFEANETGTIQGEGIDLHWALERHPGWYCLDRASIWEDILGVPVGEHAVQLTVDKHPVLRHNRKPTLCFLPLASNYGPGGRSLPPDHAVTLARALCEHYTVVVPSAGDALDGFQYTEAECYQNLTMKAFVRLVASCDKCLGVDSGGIYVAAAAGVPTVGLFGHVDPWLRIPRFPYLSALDLRSPTCQCEQHGTCSRPVNGEAPCKYVAPEAIWKALLCQASYRCHSAADGSPTPRFAVTAARDDGKETTPTQDANLDHILAGLKARFGEKVKPDFTLTLRGDELIERDVFLQALSDLRQPGYNNKVIPIDLKRNRREE